MLEVGQKVMLHYLELPTDIPKQVLCAIDHIYDNNKMCISPYQNDIHELSMGVVLNLTDVWNNRNKYVHPNDAMGAKYRVTSVEHI